MTIEDVEQPGLRERKRLATKRAIQLAVIDLVGERGMDGVTIDEISRVADVSPRTFFNYFPSKEAALLGDPPVMPDNELIEEFVNGDGPFLEDLGAVLGSLTEKIMDQGELVRRRMRVLKQNPQLLATRMATMHIFEEQIGAVIERRLRRTHPELAGDPEKLADRARLTTLVVFSTMRHAWMRWVTGDAADDLPIRLNESFDSLRQILASPEPAILG
ncbi:MAG: TetR family transcriptional regulator [Rhodoglobus sp.]